jgi:hypothetical protein
MRSGTLLVHSSLRCFSVLFPLEQQIYRLLISSYSEVIDALDVDTFLWPLSDLEGLEVFCEEVENLLVVDFHIRALDRELICGGFYVPENVL